MTEAQNKKGSDHDHTFIREVRVNYVPTATRLFAVQCPHDVAAFVRSVLIDNSREHFVALYLDGAHQISSYSVISIGSANMTCVQPRDVFQRAIISGAVALAIAHNHPSGDLTPSKEDLGVTNRLKDAGELLGIRLLDHLIVTTTAFFSIQLNHSRNFR